MTAPFAVGPPAPVAERSAEVHVGYGVTIGWRAIDGLPALGLAPFAVVWLRFDGRCFWCWNDGIGGRS